MSTRGGSDYSGRRRPATAQATRQTLRERGAEATRLLREALHLPIVDLSDVTILGTALASAAAWEIQRNPQFADAVRREYDELVALRGAPTRRASRNAQPSEPLVPLRHTGEGIAPYAPPDPQKLIYVFGADKLARALYDYTLDMLKETAEQIQQQHPGTKPKSRASKASVIAYIVEHTPVNGR